MKAKKLIVLTLLATLLVSTVACGEGGGEQATPTPAAPATPAQPEPEWSTTFGGSAHDRGYSVQQTPDGGFIVAGDTASFGGVDVYLIKTDASGHYQWKSIFPGYDPWDGGGRSVQQTSDGGFVIAGWRGRLGDEDVYLIKTDVIGNEKWTTRFGIDGSDGGRSVQQTSDGGFVIAGGTEYLGAGGGDVYLIRTDASGNEQWKSTFGGPAADSGFSVQQTSDGGFVIAGWTKSFGAGREDVYLIKTDASGNEQWSATFGGPANDDGYSVQQTSDGGFIVAGGTRSFGADGWDVYLIRTDASGNEQWSATFGGPANDGGTSVQQTSDGGFVIAGWTESFGAGGGDVYLIRTDASGNEQWSATFGGPADDVGYSVQQTSDGGFVIAGWTDSFGAGGFDVYLIKVAPEG